MSINKDFSRAETIRELAQRHLQNEHHTTTDDELRNAMVEVTEDIDIVVDSENFFKDDKSPVKE